ncbi:arylsulfatase [Leptospira brenneri]|uniref:Arylsulfatase n=1 Tax=Leptospira brenneri TaxID=2023182 RepID=A0A2M9Y7A0_9LEPT|nr:arylsulfatase [Leptospira brenneri]TGK97150.1 arylsulfatase [Leptospira brenneri]
MKLSKLGEFFKVLQLISKPTFLLYIFFYIFYGPISFSLGSWFYFHGIFVTILTFFCVMIHSFLKGNLIQKNSGWNMFYRLVLWAIFMMALGYQQVYQTEITISIVIYFFQHIFLLYSDIFNFLSQWNLWQCLSLGIGFYLIITEKKENTKKKWMQFLVCSLLFFLFRFGIHWIQPKENFIETSIHSSQRAKSSLESISGKPNLVMVLLEGVPRKHLVKLKSRYINFSLLNGSHFWIPMPHTSKSLFTWMTGESQLSNTRLQGNETLLESNLPKELEIKHGYQTEMIYTQSIYFEGMEQFFPKIFQTILEKSELEKRYGSSYSSFSWGMDDRILIPAMKSMVNTNQDPKFLFLGLSQTHSPYFVSQIDSNQRWKSPMDRYMGALMEEIEVLDSIISFWKENSSRETVLILSSDHGESFGEEGAHAHNYSLYNQETDVPFLLYFIKSGQVYIPKSGSSVNFKDTVLGLLETKANDRDPFLNPSFFSSDYQMDLVLKTWNSEIQKAWITKEKKYIYHSDRDQLIEMNWEEGNKNLITDPVLKQRVMNQIYSNIR